MFLKGKQDKNGNDSFSNFLQTFYVHSMLRAQTTWASKANTLSIRQRRFVTEPIFAAEVFNKYVYLVYRYDSRYIGMISAKYRYIPVIGICLIWISKQKSVSVSVSVWYKFLKGVSVSVCCISVWPYRYQYGHIGRTLYSMLFLIASPLI